MNTTVALTALLLCFSTASCMASEKSHEGDLARQSARLRYSSGPSPNAVLLKINVVSDKKLEFDLNRGGSLADPQKQIHGIANLIEGDSDILEDGEGNSYPADEFIHKGECWVSIQIDDSRNFAKVTVAECEVSSSFEGGKVLMRRQAK